MLPNLSCRAQSSDLRNVHLEGIVEAVIYPCPFEKLVAAKCGFSHYPFDVRKHVRELHLSECWEGTGDGEWIQLPGTFVQYQKAIFQLDQLFFLLWSINADWLSFIVFHVGHENDSSGYIYDFKIENGVPLISSYGSTCRHYLQDGNEVMQSRQYVLWHLNSVRSLLDRPDVKCSLKIRRPQPQLTEGNEPIYRYNAGSSDFVPQIF
jgi:hypothetical protein